MQRWMAAAVTALILVSGAAHAQIANDSSAPVDVSADEQEVINSQCKQIFRGNVEVLQDKARLRAAVINVYNKRKGGTGSGSCGDAERLEADGDVFYVTADQTVRAELADRDELYRNPRHPYILAWDVAKVAKLKKTWPGLYKGK